MQVRKPAQCANRVVSHIQFVQAKSGVLQLILERTTSCELHSDIMTNCTFMRNNIVNLNDVIVLQCLKKLIEWKAGSGRFQCDIPTLRYFARFVHHPESPLANYVGLVKDVATVYDSCHLHLVKF